MIRPFTRAAIVLLLAAGCAPIPPGVEGSALTLTGPTMGTRYMVKVLSDDGWTMEERNNLAETIKRALEVVNQKMSTYVPDSELSRFNQSDSTQPFPISADTMRVFDLALEVSEKSDGAFDVTVGPLVNAWGFGPEGQPEEIPSDAEIADLQERVGYEFLTIDPDRGTIRKAIPELYCDLSAVAKGFGVDEVARLVEELGYSNYLVEIGGEIRCRGQNADGVVWRIAIERPESGRRVAQRVVALEDAAMASSGDYRNYYERDGERLSHTIDPRTGRPIAHKLAAVSVINDECAVADAYATAIMVLGPDEGYALAEAENLAALLIVREGEDFVERATPAFDAVMDEAI